MAFNSYNYLEQIALGEFSSGGMPEDVELLKKVMASKAAEGAKQMQAADVELPKGKDGSVYSGVAAAIGTAKGPEGIKDLKARGITPETWMAIATAKFEGYSEVEKALVDKAVTEAVAISDDAKSDAWLNGAIVVVALLAAFILAGMMARQMSRSMRTLRTAAFGIAEQRLPMLVDQLSRTEPGRVDTRVQPIPIDSQDEIGEVARAFDQVHREAVRLAAEQAMLRGNVNAIFTNLSRRNQSLIEGQLTLITDLENNEADPDQLENLFKLDHLATRMRRNGENLSSSPARSPAAAGTSRSPGRRHARRLLRGGAVRAHRAGGRPGGRDPRPGRDRPRAPARRAPGERHHLLLPADQGPRHRDPPARRPRDGRDPRQGHRPHRRGLRGHQPQAGQPADRGRRRLAAHGLFVVGRLADRHGIRVQLRPSGEQAGTTSLVMLPDAITHGGGGEQPIQDDFTVSQIIPEQQQQPQNAFEAAPAQPMLTAADLGFDDSRYEQQPDGEQPNLDPVNRSLRREGRRAALGDRAQNGDRPLFRDEAEQQQGEYGQAREYGQEQAVPGQEYAQEQPQGQEYAAEYAPRRSTATSSRSSRSTARSTRPATRSRTVTAAPPGPAATGVPSRATRRTLSRAMRKLRTELRKPNTSSTIRRSVPSPTRRSGRIRTPIRAVTRRSTGPNRNLPTPLPNRPPTA